MNSTPEPQTAVRDRIAAALAEKFTPDGKPDQGMRFWFEGPDGWPASRQVTALEAADVAAAAVPVTVPPAQERRDQIRRVLAEADGFRFEDLEPHDYQKHAAAVLAVADAEQAELRERHKASLRRADEINNQLMEEVQRYAAGTERPVLWSVYNEMHKRAITAETRAEAMERAMQSTAADALRHGGCHRKLMAQCLRAEKAEAEVARLQGAVLPQPETQAGHEHVGGNAEDCPGCEGTNPPYPFICPGPAATAPAVVSQPDEEA